MVAAADADDGELPDCADVHDQLISLPFRGGASTNQSRTNSFKRVGLMNV